ncbi:MAG: single-stranded DNA-binding protein [Gammaproteobacteria bacterium]|jgi:single-strand DNA-binding protein|nr:single-stranded DNA-binding protein [Gammaproteobacteria bacterium]MBT7523316.1 single-stranded DNA-binding protein [Gammaproteobacteria bacterium]MBT7814518.1 single-stranded DNA-binding protein [Gammaproteobacteria bacterium]MDA9896699.1 single-stranded DNA-binding protein [Gammaproteobacteria bacterium]|tara:strand:- start:1124 stop:1573 length:450 start_codon:yes stop_codon:yes gene_type:complete
MAGVNKVIILGRLGADPELRSSPSGVTSCNLSIATSQNWTDKSSGEKKEKTEWHRIVFFGRSAEIIDQYVKKGQELYIEGSLSTSKYEKDGIERYTTNIIGSSFNFISGSGSSSSNSNNNQFNDNMNQDVATKSQETSSKDDFDDDIPF